MNNEVQYGVFPGRKLIQTNGSLGDSRHVFVKLQGKDSLIFPTLGGKIMNPPTGKNFKMFAGDLAYFKLDDNGTKPEVYLLKTYLVHSVSTDKKTVNIVRDAYKHVPFVGDKLGVAPDTVGGDVTSVTVTAVASKKDTDGTNIWALTVSDALTTVKDDVLVEAGADGKMLVKDINAVLPTDLDLTDAATADEGFDGAKYIYTPAIGGLMYINKMSPLPACVKAVNKSKFNGWFQVGNII